MKEYKSKRLTARLSNDKYTGACWNCEKKKGLCTDEKCLGVMKQRLGELEDKIEQQELIDIKSIAELLYKWFKCPCYYSHTNFDFAEYMNEKYGDWCEDNCGKNTVDSPICWEMYLKAKLAELRGGGMNEKLLKCPFCGGKAELIPTLGKGFNYVRCTECEIEQPTYDTKQKAINAWNTRVKE